MVVSRKNTNLTIYHTEIKPEAKGKGLGVELFDHMITYVQKEGLMVRPLCPFVSARFSKVPGRYEAIWIKAD